ncbi:MAG: dihydroorotate dehydrogenase electron transfer subunit [Ruminococcaceae bacterium]|nr:dihydroorotate dehydrogenase electron transfer subunit [Oscillospiraceae bacterium]
MKQILLTVDKNERIARDIWRMELVDGDAGIERPGQFVNIALPDFYLRRPISVCDYTPERLTLIYKAVGQGTEYMTSLPVGTELDLLSCLGNGFDVSVPWKKPLLVGGGVGAPPLYKLAKELIAAGKQPHVLLGFASAEDVFLADEFAALGVPVTVTTADGTAGIKGFVTTAMPDIDFDGIFACGPIPMLRALCEATDKPAQLSFEERMACGFGACMGCSRMTKNGAKRICKDGPVMDREEIIWQ